MSTDDAMSPAEIARLWGVHRSVTTRAAKAGDLGEPTNPGATRPTYARSAAVAAGRRRGYLDERGRPVERDKAERRRPIPLPYVSPATKKKLYFVPDVAAMFSTEEWAVHQWVVREVLPKGGDEPEQTGEYPAWWMSTIREASKRIRNPLNEKAKRPGQAP